MPRWLPPGAVWQRTLIGRAKDLGSAAVMLAIVMAFVVWVIGLMQG